MRCACKESFAVVVIISDWILFYCDEYNCLIPYRHISQKKLSVQCVVMALNLFISPWQLFSNLSSSNFPDVSGESLMNTLQSFFLIPKLLKELCCCHQLILISIGMLSPLKAKYWHRTFTFSYFVIIVETNPLNTNTMLCNII